MFLELPPRVRRPCRGSLVIGVGWLFLLAILIFLTKFHDDGSPTSSVQGKNAKSIQQALLRREVRDVEDCNSNETVTSEGGTLTSPGYPIRYLSNTDCRWLLTAPDGANIVLRIKSLNLEKGKECELDYLEIHLGETTLSPSHEKLCGSVTDKVIVTNSSTVLLAFHSDPSYEDKGFSIDYYIQSSEGCPATVTTPSGTISSPNFPANYPDNTDCWTLISVDKGKTISFQFDTLELEFDENCTYDHVQIFDGPSRDSPLLGKFCSSNQRIPIHSTANQMLVYFHSDHLVNKKGFQAQYTTTTSILGVRISDLGGCLWKNEGNKGTIASPNYPQKYPSNAKCQIVLEASPGETINLDFEMLQLEAEANCTYDVLKIQDGIDPDSNETQITKLCGRQNEPKHLNSTSNIILLEFSSDDFAEFSGFKASYHFIKLNNDTDSEEMEEVAKTINEDIEDIFIQKPQNATLSFGSPYMLECSVLDPVAKIRWLKDEHFLGGNNPLPGVKLLANNTLWIQSLNKQLVGIYTCAAVTPEKTYYAVASLRLTNYIEENDTSCGIVFRKTPRDSTFTEGEFAHMECLAAGNQVRTHWEKDGKPLESTGHVTVVRNGFLFIDKVQLQDRGIYTCITKDLIADCERSVAVTLTVNEKAKLSEICGKPKVGQPSKLEPHLELGKIVGGHDTKNGAYPWQVMLWEPQLKSFCGGTLLNERWIITAAHCLESYKGLRWENIIIKLGKHSRVANEPDEFRTAIADKVIHPAYNKNNFDNDIALIHLRDHVKFSDYILPICLGSWEFFEEEEENKVRMGTVTGWGKLKDRGLSPTYLQEIQLPMVPQKTCVDATEFVVTRNMFCAGYAQEVLGDACSGDSGGPFVVNRKNRWYLVGIVSWGEGCGEVNKYGYYTKVANYLPWIKGIMKS